MAIIFGIFGALGLGILMVVHELGHYLAARAFKMRVTRFSIGFGPALFRHTPKGSPTTYQLAIIPLLAYVQIAGMNPLDEVDPKDEGSYANASLVGRIVTIFAGPLFNYLFASVLFFAAMMIGGQLIPTTKVTVQPGSAAEAGQMKTGDKVVEVAGQSIHEWDQMKSAVAANPGKPIDVTVERDGHVVHLTVKPAVIANGEGRIGVGSVFLTRPATLKEASEYAIKAPATVVVETLVGLGQMLTGKQKLDNLAGPVGIVRETANAARDGAPSFFRFLGIISAYLGAFNLLPIPALDGGRLMFLAYEATTRRRPNPKVEAQVHAIGLVMMLALVLVVTLTIDIPGKH